MQRTRSIARRFAPVLLVCAALAFPSGASAATPCANSGLTPSTTNSGQVQVATMCLINQQRTRRGLRRLSPNGQLENAARRYSQLMVARRFFGHVSPGGSTLVSRVRRGTSYLRGARSWALSENLSWGAGWHATPVNTVRAWMRSPGHRRNILSPGFRHIGIGVTTGAPFRTRGFKAATYTADFGRRS